MTSKPIVAVILCFVAVLVSANPFSKKFRESMPNFNGRWNPGDDEGALFLTPYIKAGRIEEGRKLALQTEIFKTHKSYSGFITINDTTSSNMFFWFFPAENQDPNAPVLMWLQGGPGGASCVGAMEENSPYYIDKDGNLQDRKVHWADKYNIIFVDNPIGAGFSFAKTEDAYVRTETEVGINLFKFLIQFFRLFPELSKNPFYLTGESYAGKYIPAIGYRIHLENEKAGEKLINLVGMAIGDGWTVPAAMIPYYAELLQNLQLIDEPQKAQVEDLQEKSMDCIKKGDFKCAFDHWNALIDGDLGVTSLYHNLTGFNNYYNYLMTESDPFYSPRFLTKEDTRRALHVGKRTMQPGEIVEKYLLEDMMQSIEKELIVLMENYKVLLYNGALDVIIHGALSDKVFQHIEWSGKQRFLNAKRAIWRVEEKDREIAGYIRYSDKLSFASIRGAGHLVPADQPEAMKDLLDRFIENNYPEA